MTEVQMPCSTTEHSSSNMQRILGKLDMDEILNCMHCGFCLPTCPTYEQTGLETHSPRGRIALMKGVAEEKLPVDEEFETNMYACLGCRACETACPAGVGYGSLIETAREVIEDVKHMNQKKSFVRSLVFRHLFTKPARVRLVGHVLWILQATGLQKLANRTGLIRMLPREMAEMQEVVPQIASPAQRRRRDAWVRPDPSTSDSPRPLRIGLFTGCIMDVMFYATNQATARVLSKAGCEVVFVGAQGCCGALHAHSGEKVEATKLAKRNIMVFEEADIDFVVNNAGGCGAALKEYSHWLRHDDEWRDRAESFVTKVRDVNELLVALPHLTFSKPLNARVTYQDSCHLAHGQGVRNQPRQLLKNIPGIDYVELPFANNCCGSAGIYNITNFETSMKVLDDKMEQVKTTHAHFVVTSNPGCLLQMKKGIVRAGLADQMEAVHIMDLLNRVL